MLLWIIGIYARFKITIKASNSVVDGYYWELVSKAFRTKHKLPIDLPNKYLMEDSRQAYPPLFAILLGIFLVNRPKFFWMLLFEIIALGILLKVLVLFQAPTPLIIFATGSYVAAPILVTYNSQLTPRVLGDILLFLSMITQLFASQAKDLNTENVWLWIASSFFIALIIMTHKMTLQLYIFLMPWWAWALKSWEVPLFTILGFIIFFILVGWNFGIYQLRGHIDVIRFWHKHWHNLGAHQFMHSPIYGYPNRNKQQFFHLTGRSGVIKHLRTVIAYAPINIILPIASMISNTLPPLWVITWFGGTYIWAISTLFFDNLKCFGGGHLYVFNTIAVGVVYITFLPLTQNVMILLLIGTLATIGSLRMAFKIISSRKISLGSDFEGVEAFLQNLPKSNIAIFPLQTAEAIAYKTKHAVLWGAHGSGFEPLNGFYPVLTKPLDYFLEKYNIKWVIWDSSYWGDGESTLVKNLIINPMLIKSYGNWRIAGYLNFDEFREDKVYKFNFNYE